MFDAVILSDARISAAVQFRLNARKIIKLGSRAPVAVNIFKAMTNWHFRHWDWVDGGVAFNVTDLSTRRIENRNVDVKQRGKV